MENRFHCSVNGQNCGPYTLLDLQRYLQAGQLPVDTLVWNPATNQWEQIQNFLRFNPPTPQTQFNAPVPQPQLNPVFTGNPTPNQFALPAQQPFINQSQIAHPTNLPHIKHGVSDKTVSKYISSLPQGTRPIASVKTSFDVSWLVIMIPLWFNIRWTYVLFTDRQFAFCDRTLWSGCMSPTFIEYESVQSIMLLEKKHTLINDFYIVVEQIDTTTEPIEFGPILKPAYRFLTENMHILNQLPVSIQVLKTD